MITQEETERAWQFIRDHSTEAGELWATMETLKDWTEHLEAKLMQEIEGPEHVKKAYARSHESYRQHIYLMHMAREEWKKLDFLMKAAETKISMWQTQSRNERIGP